MDAIMKLFAAFNNIPFFLRMGVAYTVLFLLLLLIMDRFGASLKWKRNMFSIIFATYILFCSIRYLMMLLFSLLIDKVDIRVIGNIIIPNTYFVVWVPAFFLGKAISAYFLNIRMWRKYAEEGVSFRDFLEKSTGNRKRFSYNFQNEIVKTEPTETSE